MTRVWLRSLAGVLLGMGAWQATWAGEPRAYVYFGADRERIAEKSFLEARGIVGAQIRYSWRQLEHGEGEYDFGDVRHDVEFLGRHGKRLFVQVQDVSFSPEVKPFPRYLLNDPKYHGGAAPQYEIPKDDEDRATKAGWVARRWDPAVRERFAKLLEAMGRELDGAVEGVNLAETAVEFGESGRLWPEGFTPVGYREGVIENMRALRRAFPKSVVIVYANFMPGGKGEDGTASLKAVYEAAVRLGAGVGGPDVLPHRGWQMRNSYPLIREVSAKVPAGMAVQEGNLDDVDRETGRRVTAREVLGFARDYLHVGYLFWGTQEPYYSRDVLPMYRGRR